MYKHMLPGIGHYHVAQPSCGTKSGIDKKQTTTRQNGIVAITYIQRKTAAEEQVTEMIFMHLQNYITPTD